MCGKHLRKGTSPGCADGFCWEGHSQWSSRWASWGPGEVSWQGSGPWIAFLWAEGSPPNSADDRPSALDRARALDSSWETAAGTQGERCREPGGVPQGLYAGSLLPCPGAWLEEKAFSLARLEAGKAMTSWASAVSTHVH